MAESIATATEEYRMEDLEILKTIGKGTFARLLLCQHRPSNRYCALKVFDMERQVRMQQVDHIYNEKTILQAVSHPFIVKLLWHHQDAALLYLLLEYVPGGELFTYLRKQRTFSHDTAVFYASEVVSALSYLHSLSIVYRDVKPENLLLDRDGHLKITDFGFSKKISGRTWTLCGTPEYLAPEVVMGKGHNKAVDWWALGVLIFEMLCGGPPFADEDVTVNYTRIINCRIRFPKHLEESAMDIVVKLVEVDLSKRLGSGEGGGQDVMAHKFFKSVSWKDVYERKTQPPIVPVLSHAGDHSNFDDYPDEDLTSKPPASKASLAKFADF